MLIASFFSWWYGRGWSAIAQSLQPRINGVLANFSVPQLSRTLFQPWRKIITYPGASLQDKMRAWGDNIFSRMIGFVIRITVLMAAFVAIIFVAIATAIELIVWPLLPALVPGSLIIGIII